MNLRRFIRHLSIVANPSGGGRRDVLRPSFEQVASLNQRLRSQGYKPEVRNGTKIYCRKETEMGSRFPSKTCATADQLSAANKDGQDALNKVQLQSAPVKAN